VDRPAWRNPPAYARPLLARRKRGERIGLLVVALHDDHAGSEYVARSHTARIQLTEDMLPHEMDWSCVVALDCLLVGQCDDAVLYAAATMLYAAGAASIWAEYPDGVHRLERWHSTACPTGFYACDGPVPPARLGAALAAHRAWALMRRDGVYGTELFDASRDAQFEHTFGPLASKAQNWLAGKLGQVVRAAA
jgi:hypothetical protein